MLTLNDGRKELYQWDAGRTATVDIECDVVHFSNLKYGESLAVEVKEGEVSIPNKLLMSGEPIYCWAVVKDDSGSYTKKEQTFTVIKRAKPSDYVYTETEVITIKTAVEKALEEAKESGEFKGEKGDKGDRGERGERGEQGVKGEKGDDGYTPQKGVDYFTDEDMAELNAAVTNANTAAEGAENVNISAMQTTTGADITVTNREGEQTTVHIDTLAAVNTWEDIKNAVRLGLGEKLFPVGYEFTTEDSVTGAVITWVVRGHDNHIAANNKLTHTMTLETKYVYGTANGTYRSFVFDATEALYYAAEELPASTYNFTLLAGYDTTYGGGKTLSFTLTKPVPAGGVIMFPWGYQKQSTDTKISTYASNAATAAIESVAVTESADGTSLGIADGTVENLNHTHRIRYGSNNYAQSAARQWLNSDAAAGSVWAPTNVFDRPPSWNTSYNGFVRGLPADFLAVVQPAAIPCRTNSIFEVNSLDGTEFAINQVYTLKDKFFLLSRPEIYGTWDSATYKDGTLLEFYEGLTDTERIKYDAAGSARYYWLRSPYPGYAYHERSVYTSGVLYYNYAYYASGVAPACIIA